MIGSAFDGPEVIKKAQSARWKRRLIRWGLFLYYIAFCVAAEAYLIYMSREGTHLKPVIDLRPYESYFQNVSPPQYPTLADALRSNASLLIPFAFIALFLAIINWSPLRRLRPLPDYQAIAPLQVSRLNSCIEAVSLATGRPFLPCLVMTSSMPNALAATIGSSPKLVVTSGLLNSDFTQNEMMAVVAHESVHVETRCTLGWRSPSRLFFSLAAYISLTFWWVVSVEQYLTNAFVGVNAFFFDLVLFLLFLPIPIAFLLEIHLNRQDDLFADATAVMITRDPEALMSAIEKVAASGGTISYSLMGAGALIDVRGNGEGVMPRRASKYLFVDPLQRGRGSEIDRKWKLSVLRLFGDNLTIIKRPANKHKEDLRSPRGERAGLLHDRLTALRQIIEGDATELQLLKVPSDEWK